MVMFTIHGLAIQVIRRYD